MEQVLGPMDAILLRSPNGQYQVRLYLGDDGFLYADLFFRKEEDRYEPQPGVGPARLAHVDRGPDGKPAWFQAG
jgi:hypothetical protein